jgi:hypothetical protein
MAQTKSKSIKDSKKSNALDSDKKTKASSVRKPTKKSVSVEEMQNYIQTNAYFRAQNRGFASEFQLQDWLDAEAEIQQSFRIKKPAKKS